MYRAESGALVFGAGTVFWSWGLDDQHEGAATPEDQNVKQAMVNMFADMGIQPGTLDASLMMATPVHGYNQADRDDHAFRELFRRRAESYDHRHRPGLRRRHRRRRRDITRRRAVLVEDDRPRELELQLGRPGGRELQYHGPRSR